MTKNIAIVVSEFNTSITEKLLHGCKQRLNELGIQNVNILVTHVPGAIEIPLIAQLLAKSKRYAAIICLGAVIRGETSHYDYVCQQVSAGCLRVMLDFEIPIIFGILTTENIQQAEDRIGGNEGHKGKEAADTAIAMIKAIDAL